jgi:hypothetical protein
MNKKLIALMIVPIMLTLSGAMAYSAFSGTALTKVTATAGDITANEYAELVTGYSHNTNITVTGGFGHNTDTAFLNDSTVISLNGEPNLATVPSTSTGAQYIVYYINVSNLAPGNWVKVHMTLTNKGSVGLVFGIPVIEADEVSFSGSGLNLSNVTGSLGLSDIFTTSNPLSGVAGLSGSSGYTFATSDSSVTVGGAATSGYAFAFGPTVSDFGISLTNGGEADYSFYVGLSAGAGNGYQESSISIPIFVSVTSDP